MGRMKTIAQKWYVVVITMMMACCGLVNGCMAEEGVLLAGGELTNWEMIRKDQDKGVFYNSKACNTTGGGGAMLLSGDTIEEKIWNYFVQAGIPGLSDNPAAIAGIMGNFYDESGYNPFMIGSSGGYYGLYMLQSPQGPQMARNITSAIGGRNLFRFWGWWGSNTEVDSDLEGAGVSKSEVDTAIKMELDYLMNELATFEGFKNNLDAVANKTGEEGAASYAELFMVTVERAVSLPGSKYYGVSQAVEDPSVWNYVMNKLYTSGKYHSSSLRYQHIKHRRENARNIYNRLTGGASDGGMSDSSLGDESDFKYELDLATVTSDITLIGDSISVYSESELMKKFPNSFLNKVGSRHSTTKGWCDGDEGGLSVLRKIVSGSGTVMNQHQGQNKCEAVSVDSSALKENVVWALGTNTNGAKNQSTLEGVLEAIGGRKLYLVTPYNMIPDRMGDTDEIADLYRSFADAHDNVYVIDWNKNVRDNVSQYIDNSDHLGVHPTSAGSELFAKLIAEAVSGSRSCTTYSGDYPQYLQCDARWKDKKYGGSTMCDAGCGPASLAMLVTVATGKDVSPMDVAEITQDPPYYLDKVGGEWKRDDNTRKVCEKFGCEAKEIENTEDAIRQALKEGWMIHLSGGGGSTASETAFPTDGHYVGIFSIDDEDNVMIADPAGDAHQNKKGRFNRKLTLNNALKDRWKDRPIMAIRGNGGSSGKNTCEVAGTYCAAEGSEDSNSGSTSGQIGEEGLTFEDAKRFMMNYGENKNGSSKAAVNKDGSQWKLGGCNGGGGSNCVTFSAFFINKFTDSIRNRGHGDVTAKNMTNVEGKGQEPRVWAVFSGWMVFKSGKRGPHTAVILGYHNGEWIVGHASCSGTGTGRGNGGDGTYAGRGSGAGFVIKSKDIKTALMGYNFQILLLLIQKMSM